MEPATPLNPDQLSKYSFPLSEAFANVLLRKEAGGYVRFTSVFRDGQTLPDSMYPRVPPDPRFDGSTSALSKLFRESYEKVAKYRKYRNHQQVKEFQIFAYPSGESVEIVHRRWIIPRNGDPSIPRSEWELTGVRDASGPRLVLQLTEGYPAPVIEEAIHQFFERLRELESTRFGEPTVAARIKEGRTQPELERELQSRVYNRLPMPNYVLRSYLPPTNAAKGLPRIVKNSMFKRSPRRRNARRTTTRRRRA